MLAPTRAPSDAPSAATAQQLRRPPRRRATGGWRRARRIVLAAAGLCLIPVLVSYVHMLAQPSNSSVGIRTVEWLRENGARGIVNHGHENLIYAAANDQTVSSLAAIMIHAGAVRAMELDINTYWTSFITYHHPGAGDPANLLPTMDRSPERYLTPDDRDFFAVYTH